MLDQQGHSKTSMAPALEPLEERVLLSLSDPAALICENSLAFRSEECVAAPATVYPATQLAVNEGLLRQSENQPGVFLAAPGLKHGDIHILATHNTNAADTTNTEELWSGGGLGLELSGDALRIGIWDEVHVRAPHVEFSGRVGYGDSPVIWWGDHATHVAGTMAAAGEDIAAHGMASQVQVTSYDWASDVGELRAAAQTLVASNHSYGIICGWGVLLWDFGGVKRYTDIWAGNRTLHTEDASFGKYSARSASFDDVVYDEPHLLSIWAAGNDRDDLFQNIHQTLYGGDSIYVTWLEADSGTIVGGQYQGPGYYPVLNAGATLAPGPDEEASDGYDTLTPEASAKNNLVVGAVDDVLPDPYGVGDVVMSDFSSWGATDDGRVKVDVVANGVGVYSTGAAANDDYFTGSGTSMAAPNVTGTAALLIEHYEDLFGDRPLAATTKGLLLHTAFDAGNTGPDYSFGWGLVDAAAAANFLTDASDDGDPSCWALENTYDDSEFSWTLISDGSGPLKATICWTDPAGDAQGSGLDDTTSVLVNDLDLWLTGPDGTTYYPWTLDPANPADPAVRTTGNHLDNVEQVLIDAPGAGTYTIHVGGTLDGSYEEQAYSLLVGGATEAINGTGGNDTMTLIRDSLDPDLAQLSISGGATYSIQLPSLSLLYVNGLAGNDELTVDFAEGDPLPSGGLEYDGGSGSDTLRIDGSTSADTVSCTTTQATVNSSDIDHTGVESLVLALGGGENAVEVEGGFGVDDLRILGGGSGSYTFEADDPSDTATLAVTLQSAAHVTILSSLRLEALSLMDTSVAVIERPDPNDLRVSRTLSTDSLFIAGGDTPTACLDLKNNNLIVYYESGQSSFSEIEAWVRAGLNLGAGYWNGNGITSSIAANPAQNLNYCTAVGVIDNLDIQEKVGGLEALEGVALEQQEAVLVRFTWWGDANLDGVVDTNDYDLIDRTWLLGPDEDGLRWANGDFNYNGVLNTNDYDLIDRVWLLHRGEYL